jgi:cobalamin biosynthesis protein CobW
MSAPIPVTIVTGFLGSGKTTLLRSLVARRQTRRLALLINEFGEISIDGALIREESGGSGQILIHDFPYGLIAYGDDERFIPIMQEIAARRGGVDHVLIETSGLALPTAVMEILQGPELNADFILDATLAVVDTPLLLAHQFEEGAATGYLNDAAATATAMLFAQQLEFADVVVLNKIDQLNEAQLLQAEEQVRRCAPQVRFLELAQQARLDIRVALGLRLHQPTLTAHAHRYTALPPMPGPASAVLTNQDRLNGHAHSGMEAHTHGLATHKHFHEQDPGWLSFVLRATAPQSEQTLHAALVAIAGTEPVLRSKGFVQIVSAARPRLVQGVRTRVTITTDEAREPSNKSELVFIGFHLSRSRVAEQLSALTDTHWR